LDHGFYTILRIKMDHRRSDNLHGDDHRGVSPLFPVL
jgi:hypothetical protein